MSSYYSGATSNHNISLIWSHYRPSFWPNHKDQVWSQGQPTTRVSNTNMISVTKNKTKFYQCFRWSLTKNHSSHQLHWLFCSNRYRWTKDGEDFTPPDVTTNKTDHTGGTFVLHNKHHVQFQGKYRCYASNKLGTAMTEEIELIFPSE